MMLPEKMVNWTGIGPLDHTQLLIRCLALIIIVLIVGWTIEKLFERAGKTAVRLAFEKTRDFPVTLVKIL